MMEDKKILSEEVVLSEVILDRTNRAFEMIRQERMVDMNIHNEKKRRFFRSQIAAIVGIGLLIMCGVGAAATIHHYWGRGMKGNLQADETQQQQLVDDGIAEVYPEKEDYESLKVTQNGVTIVPHTVLADERFAYISFVISGYNIDQEKEPDFEITNVKSQDVEVNSYGQMYNGIVSGEDGKPVYEDGTPIHLSEGESVVDHYFDENGNLEYTIVAHVSNEKDSILGKMLEVDFQNLGFLEEQEYENVVDGTWDFEIKLPSVSAAKDIQLNKEIAGTDFKITNVELSPISMKANYIRLSESATGENEPEVPTIEGVILKDGTRLPYLMDTGDAGYYTGGSRKAYNLSGYDRVIDVEKVQALLIRPYSDGEIVIVDMQ